MVSVGEKAREVAQALRRAGISVYLRADGRGCDLVAADAEDTMHVGRVVVLAAVTMTGPGILVKELIAGVPLQAWTVVVASALLMLLILARMVRLVRQLATELGTTHGTVQRVASQLGYGVESVRSWVRQAEVDDGLADGVSSQEAARARGLEQRVRELERANEILRRASIFFAAELDRRGR